MGYSTNKSTLYKILPQLTYLVKGEACVWTVETGTVSKFAYKIREALYIARLYPLEFPELARAASHFTIEIVNPRQVQARPAKNTPAAMITQGGTINTGLENAGLPDQKMGQQTASSVIETWLAAQPSNNRFHFPQAQMNAAELMKLHLFTQEHKLLMFVAADGALTVQRHERGLEDLAWGPEDL